MLTRACSAPSRQQRAIEIRLVRSGWPRLRLHRLTDVRDCSRNSFNIVLMDRERKLFSHVRIGEPNPNPDLLEGDDSRDMRQPLNGHNTNIRQSKEIAYVDWNQL